MYAIKKNVSEACYLVGVIYSKLNRRYVYMLLATLLLMLLSAVAEVVSLEPFYPSSVLSQTKSTLLPRSGKLILDYSLICRINSLTIRSELRSRYL